MFARLWSVAVWVLAATASLHCQESRQVTQAVGSDAGTDGDTDADTDADSDADSTGCALMDILFVIDDSGSMACEQLMLAEAFPEFIEVIQQYNNENADQVSYRVGVTTTGRNISCWVDLGEDGIDTFYEWGHNGRLLETSGDEKWLDGPGDVDQLSAKFAELADVGVDGPDPEMPLDCLRLAIDKDAQGEPNEGFLRDDALFVGVIITDEDDYSLTVDTYECGEENFPWDSLVPLDEYKAVLDERFGGPDRYVLSVIAGAQTCTETDWASDCEEGDVYLGALHADRLEEFVWEQMGESGHFADICTTDLTDALDDALDLVTAACDQYPIE